LLPVLTLVSFEKYKKINFVYKKYSLKYIFGCGTIVRGKNLKSAIGEALNPFMAVMVWYGMVWYGMVWYGAVR